MAHCLTGVASFECLSDKRKDSRLYRGTSSRRPGHMHAHACSGSIPDDRTRIPGIVLACPGSLLTLMTCVMARVVTCPFPPPRPPSLSDRCAEATLHRATWLVAGGERPSVLVNRGCVAFVDCAQGGLMRARFCGGKGIPAHARLHTPLCVGSEPLVAPAGWLKHAVQDLSAFRDHASRRTVT